MLALRNIAVMTKPAEDTGLTAEQMQFAKAHHATSCAHCAEDFAVCLYREQPRETVRWIIDRDAYVLERAEFRVGS